MFPVMAWEIVIRIDNAATIPNNIEINAFCLKGMYIMTKNIEEKNKERLKLI